MSNVIQFSPATREAVYARMCAYGPGGSGKTLTGLLTMQTLCAGQRFAVIDTERGRSKKYLGHEGLEFDIWEPHAFDPATLTEALGIAAGAGYPGIVIDGGSPYWNGVDGIQEQVDKKSAAGGRSDKFSSGWKDVAPIERRMWDSVLTYPGHVWMTLRVKVDYVVEDVQRGNRTVSAPRKVGLRPVQRDSFEYEFDLVCAMDQENTLTVTKSDLITVPQGTVIPKPGAEFAETIRDFCAQGTMATGPMTYRDQALSDANTIDDYKRLLATVERAGLRNAPMTDEAGTPTVLGDLILARGRALAPAATPAARPATNRPTAVPAQRNDTKPAKAELVEADLRDRATKGVLAMLAAGTTEAANKLADVAETSPAAGYDIFPGIKPEVSEVMGIGPDDGPITLQQFGALAADYVRRTGHSIEAGVAATLGEDDRSAEADRPLGKEEEAAA